MGLAYILAAKPELLRVCGDFYDGPRRVTNPRIPAVLDLQATFEPFSVASELPVIVVLLHLGPPLPDRIQHAQARPATPA
jgi:hypothetical protein